QLGAAGEAFFVERVHNPLRRDLATSPLTSPLREGRIDREAADNNGGRGGGGQWEEEESGAQDDWESRKPKSGRRKHSARRARGRRTTSDMDESCLASVASVEEGGGARMARASTAAESSTGTPWPSSPSATTTPGAIMSRARSLQDHLGGGSASGDEGPTTAVAWAIGAEDISGSSGGEGGGGVTTGSRAGAGGERAPPLMQDTGPPPPPPASTFRGNAGGGGGALVVSPSRPAPRVDAGGAGQAGVRDAPHHPPSTGGVERQNAPGVAGAPPANLSPPAPSGGGVVVAAGADSGASLPADSSAAGERGAADAAAGQPQEPSASPWIGRGGSDDGGGDDDGGGGGGGGGSPFSPPAAVAVHPPQGIASGGGGRYDGEAAMRICVTDVLLEAEESEPCLPPPPGADGDLRHTSFLQGLAPAPAVLHGDAVPEAEGGGTSRAHEDEPRGMGEGRGPPSSGPGVTAAAITTTKRGPEAVRVSEGDHLALAHLLLRAREDSSCLPSHREDQDKDVDPQPPATAAGPLAAGSGVGAAEAERTGAPPPPPPSQEPGPAASAAATSLPPQGCIFPGDVESEMNQEVVAIETLSADAEAWLTGEPASGGNGQEEVAAQRVIVASASGSSLGDKPRSRHGSNVDLKGFHTPHGGSATDLTELSPATERGAGEAGMGCLLAAVAGAATTARGGPDDDGGASREGWGQPRSPPRDGGVMPPGGWSVGPQSPSGAAAVTPGFSTAPSGGRHAAAEGSVFSGEPGRSATCGKAGLPAAGPLRRTASWSPPVMSLSGHLIGPEVRRGEGGGEVNKWARDAFVKEAVTWEDFSRYPQEIVQDPRLLVAVEGRLLSLSEALPHLIAASVFGSSLRQ
ncbi:unnamed protein product, partial [Ectocarpus fasciculatus]